MQVKALVPDLSKRKSILLNLCKKNLKYRILIAISWLLRVTGLLILLAGLLYALYIFEIQGLILIPLSVVGFTIPFVIGTSVKNSANYEYALPLSSYANGNLLLGESSLEYVFWIVSRHELAAYSSKHAVYNDEDKTVYSISKEDIESLDFEDGICRIKGNAIIKRPQSVYDEGFIKNEGFSTGEFSFALAFAEADAENIIKNWRG